MSTKMSLVANTGSFLLHRLKPGGRNIHAGGVSHRKPTRQFDSPEGETIDHDEQQVENEIGLEGKPECVALRAPSLIESRPVADATGWEMPPAGLVIWGLSRCLSLSILFTFSVVFSQTSFARQPQRNQNQTPRASTTNSKQGVKLELKMQSRAECPSNLLLLSDLVEVQGSDALVQQVVDLPLAPAPRVGDTQTWSRSDIEKSLSLRGVSSETIRWQGSLECSVRRVEGQRREARKPKPADSKITNGQQAGVKEAAYQEPIAKDSFVPRSQAQQPSTPIDKSQFTTAFTTPTTVAQAESIASQAIEGYLQTKTSSTGRWNITVQMPTEHAKLISQRFKILGVAGGQPPWEGQQEFQFLIKGPNGEESITIPATVKLPDMVVAAKRPLSKGYVLKEEDLDWIPMPRGLSNGPETCFARPELVVGQQLRRSMSTQQVIRINEVGPPTIIQVGDLIGISIVSGGVTVETNGRALEAGALDDLIQIEVHPHRKRVLARITGDRTAEVISNSVVSNSQSPQKNVGQTNNAIRR
jgi:flagellar basal body P-ring formation protein FlgA